MPASDANALFRAITKGQHFLAPNVIHHCGPGDDALHQRGADLIALAFRQEQDAIQGDAFAGVDRQAIDFHDVAFGDAILLAAAFHNCVFHTPLHGFTSPGSLRVQPFAGPGGSRYAHIRPGSQNARAEADGYYTLRRACCQRKFAWGVSQKRRGRGSMVDG